MNNSYTATWGLVASAMKEQLDRVNSSDDSPEAELRRLRDEIANLQRLLQQRDKEIVYWREAVQQSSPVSSCAGAITIDGRAYLPAQEYARAHNISAWTLSRMINGVGGYAGRALAHHRLANGHYLIPLDANPPAPRRRAK